ncbi:MAG: polyprenyl synthetase family protein [Chthoniobacterales bacterium]|nr:polyprenyl synthetase family protein [Chthoniobacterales bacterium]
MGPLAQVADTVQVHLDAVESRITQQAAAFDPAIEGYVAYALGGKGKRLRPLVAILSGGATGPITSAHIDLAVILELIHVATLVHDDIMDEAERRRGQTTVNARWGNTLSVLVGDCLFAQALNLSTNFNKAEISRAIAQAARDVCSGEIIQTQRRFDLHLGIDDYQQIVEMKTGSLFAVAAELGAVINEADTATVRSLKNYGLKVGTAYQIYDDCLDIAGNESVIGKTLGTDLRKGKLTLPVLMLLRAAPAAERERYCQLIVGGKAEEMTDLLRTDAAGAPLSAAVEAGQNLIEEAQGELAALSASGYSESLHQLGDGLRELLDQLR